MASHHWARAMLKEGNQLIVSIICMFLFFSCAEKVERDSGESAIEIREGLVYQAQDGELFTGTITEEFDSGIIKSIEPYSAGKRDGLWTEWYENGNGKKEVAFVEGNPHGEMKLWYKNGEPREVRSFYHGVKNGISAEWYPSGMLKRSGYYHMGERDGTWTEWSESGLKKRERTYEDGILKHDWISWQEEDVGSTIDVIPPPPDSGWNENTVFNPLWHPALERHKLGFADLPSSFPGPAALAEYDEDPVLLYSVDPRYPEKVSEKQIGRSVDVKLFIDVKGWVMKAELSGSSGEESIDQAVIEAVTHYRFRPAHRRNVPVPSVWTYSIALDDL